MKTNPLKVISGGQTGVDRAALDAALALGVPCGGWCPAGRKDERGVIPKHYPLKELKKGSYLERTIQNIKGSDGTLIIYFGDLEGGTEQTVFRCIKLHKPYKLIDGSEISVKRAIELAAAFLRSHAIRVLNAAGPRASKCPQAYPYAFKVVSGLLWRIGKQRGTSAKSSRTKS